MLSGVALSGISVILTVLNESWWAMSNTNVARDGVGFVEIFSGAMGGSVVAFALLSAAIAFRLDACWHFL